MGKINGRSQKSKGRTGTVMTAGNRGHVPGAGKAGGKEPEDFFEEEDPKHQKLLMRELKALMDSDKEGAASWMDYINGAETSQERNGRNGSHLEY